jgi:hypothetical protein
MSRARVGKLAAIASALGLGSSYVVIAGTAEIVLTGLVVLPSTKSARGIVTEKQVRDLRQSFSNSSASTPGTKPNAEIADSPFDATAQAKTYGPAWRATACDSVPPIAKMVNVTDDKRLKYSVSSNPGTNSSP